MNVSVKVLFITLKDTIIIIRQSLKMEESIETYPKTKFS